MSSQEHLGKEVNPSLHLSKKGGVTLELVLKKMRVDLVMILEKFYASNFEEVEEAYWFGPVRPSVGYACTRSRSDRDRILKFGM